MMNECMTCEELVECANSMLCTKCTELKEMLDNEVSEMELVDNMRSLVVNEDGTMEWN